MCVANGLKNVYLLGSKLNFPQFLTYFHWQKSQISLQLPKFSSRHQKFPWKRLFRFLLFATPCRSIYFFYLFIPPPISSSLPLPHTFWRYSYGLAQFHTETFHANFCIPPTFSHISPLLPHTLSCPTPSWPCLYQILVALLYFHLNSSCLQCKMWNNLLTTADRCHFTNQINDYHSFQPSFKILLHTNMKYQSFLQLLFL